MSTIACSHRWATELPRSSPGRSLSSGCMSVQPMLGRSSLGRLFAAGAISSRSAAFEPLMGALWPSKRRANAQTRPSRWTGLPPIPFELLRSGGRRGILLRISRARLPRPLVRALVLAQPVSMCARRPAGKPRWCAQGSPGPIRRRVVRRGAEPPVRSPRHRPGWAVLVDRRRAARPQRPNRDAATAVLRGP